MRQVVTALLEGGPLDVHLVAETVRTSPRTLQRRLHGAGLTYARVLQQVRFEVAQQMLKDPGGKIGDVARTLGYSDPAHFTRAFQRWTGLTPREFRRRGQDDSMVDAARKQARRRSAGRAARRSLTQPRRTLDGHG